MNSSILKQILIFINRKMLFSKYLLFFSFHEIFDYFKTSKLHYLLSLPNYNGFFDVPIIKFYQLCSLLLQSVLYVLVCHEVVLKFYFRLQYFIQTLEFKLIDPGFLLCSNIFWIINLKIRRILLQLLNHKKYFIRTVNTKGVLPLRNSF